jgi:hypothetical protein
MDGLPDNDEKALRHSTTIESLAESQGVRPDEVRSLYESVLADMKRDAVIMDFLPILAVRRVKEILLRRDAAERGDHPW